MKEEDFIKRLVELAEGFELEYIRDGITEAIIKKRVNRYGTLSMSTVNYEYVDKWEHYPLLLYRAMENIESIEIERHGVSYCFRDDNVWNHLNFRVFQPTGYLTPQEQAIETALKKVLK